MSPVPPRFVPDTNVCLDLFVFDDPQCASLRDAVRDGEVELITRADCRDEWRAVLSYPQLKLSEQRRALANERFENCVRCVTLDVPESGRMILPRCRDPDDQKFLELAHQSAAVALLTRDDALLRLARRTKREGLFVILPPALWREALSGP